jgi:orotate phosphoribosyltransferase
MEAYKKEFIEFMIDCEVLRFGDFVTKSGRKTPFFVNTGFYRSGSQLARLGEYYARAIEGAFGTDFDVLFGPAYKGIPLCAATAMKLSDVYGQNLTFTYNRNRLYFRIDHVLYRGALRAVNVRCEHSGTGSHSDHYPLLTTFVWTEP